MAQEEVLTFVNCEAKRCEAIYEQVLGRIDTGRAATEGKEVDIQLVARYGTSGFLSGVGALSLGPALAQDDCPIDLDVLEAVAGVLPVETVGLMRRVCRAWYRALASDSLWAQLTKRDFAEHEQELLRFHGKGCSFALLYRIVYWNYNEDDMLVQLEQALREVMERLNACDRETRVMECQQDEALHRRMETERLLEHIAAIECHRDETRARCAQVESQLSSLRSGDSEVAAAQLEFDATAKAHATNHRQAAQCPDLERKLASLTEMQHALTQDCTLAEERAALARTADEHNPCKSEVEDLRALLPQLVGHCDRLLASEEFLVSPTVRSSSPLVLVVPEDCTQAAAAFQAFLASSPPPDAGRGVPGAIESMLESCAKVKLAQQSYAGVQEAYASLLVREANMQASTFARFRDVMMQAQEMWARATESMDALEQMTQELQTRRMDDVDSRPSLDELRERLRRGNAELDSAQMHLEMATQELESSHAARARIEREDMQEQNAATVAGLKAGVAHLNSSLDAEAATRWCDLTLAIENITRSNEILTRRIRAASRPVQTRASPPIQLKGVRELLEQAIARTNAWVKLSEVRAAQRREEGEGGADAGSPPDIRQSDDHETLSYGRSVNALMSYLGLGESESATGDDSEASVPGDVESAGTESAALRQRCQKLEHIVNASERSHAALLIRVERLEEMLREVLDRL